MREKERKKKRIGLLLLCARKCPSFMFTNTIRCDRCPSSIYKVSICYQKGEKRKKEGKYQRLKSYWLFQRANIYCTYRSIYAYFMYCILYIFEWSKKESVFRVHKITTTKKAQPQCRKKKEYFIFYIYIIYEKKRESESKLS